MNVVLIEKKTDPLSIKIKINSNLLDEPALFLWEDPISGIVRFIDKIKLTTNSEYYSTINKNIDFFENGVTFKVIKLKDYSVIFSYEFKNLKFINGKNILYISQNSYTGYSYAARNYIYQLMDHGFNVKWDTRFTDKNFYFPQNSYEKSIFLLKTNSIENFDSVIIHHTPESWSKIYREFSKNIKVYGLTTWETTHLHSDWVKYINESVDEVIVPSRFNLESFKNSGVNKKINLWYHDIFPFVKTNIDIPTLFNKFIIYKNGCYSNNWFDIKSTINSKTVYYNISQYVSRKNVDQLIHTFCKKFTNKDNVCLFLKVYLENFSEKENDILKYKIFNIIKNYTDCPNVILCFDNLTNDEVNVIHEFGDVYFTLNRGEGFGLSTYTAKKIGNRIICGKFGAEKEFLDDNDVLLDYELRSSRHLDDFNKYYIDDKQQCAFYDTDYVVSKLKYFPKVKKELYNYA